MSWVALEAGDRRVGRHGMDQALLSIARSAYASRRPSAESEMVWALSPVVSRSAGPRGAPPAIACAKMSRGP